MSEREQFALVESIFNECVELAPNQRERYLQDRVELSDTVKAEVLALLEVFEKTDAALQIVESETKKLEKTANCWEGIVVGAYKIDREIATGGMGTVFLAHRNDKQYKQQVAIKFLSQNISSQQAHARFLAERQILAQLDHPYIAKLLDGGTTENGTPYLVMEYIEGQSIDIYAREKQLSVEQRLQLVMKVCESLEYAHRNLVIHRDIKANNILVTQDGVPKLLDFGIAKILDHHENHHDNELVVPLTHAKARIYTPGYASPEQISGEAVTTSTDVYSVGVLLYYLLTGAFPFVPKTKKETLTASVPCDLQIAPPSKAIQKTYSHSKSAQDRYQRKLSSVLKGDLDTIVLCALKNDTSRRYATISNLKGDIHNFLLKKPIAARGDSIAYRFGKFCQRNVISLSVLMICFALTVSALSFHVTKIKQERDIAQRERVRAETTLQFLNDMLANSDPTNNDGQEMSLKAFLDQAHDELNDAALDKDVEINLRRTIGNAYDALGSFERAEDQLREAFQLAKQHYSSDHEEYLRTILALAQFLHQSLRNSQEAKSLISSIIEDTAIARYPTLAFIGHRVLGDIHNAQSQHQSAKRHLDAAYNIALEIKDKSYLLSSHISLASLSRNLDLVGVADAHFRSAEKLILELEGERSPRLFVLWNNWALLKSKIHQNTQAKALFMKSLALSRELHGGTHPNQLPTLTNIAKIENENGFYDQALMRLGAAREIIQNHNLLNGHHDGINLMHTAINQVKNGLLDEAKASFAESYKILDQVFPSEHVVIALLNYYRAELKLKEQDYEAALEIYQRNQLFYEKQFGSDASVSRYYHVHLASVNRLLGRLEVAENHLQSVEDFGTTISPETWKKAVSYWLERGKLETEKKNFDIATASLLRAKETLEKYDSRDHQYFDIVVSLGKIKVLTQEVDDAKLFFEQLYAQPRAQQLSAPLKNNYFFALKTFYQTQAINPAKYPNFFPESTEY